MSCSNRWGPSAEAGWLRGGGLRGAPWPQLLHLHLIMLLLLPNAGGADSHPADALQSENPVASLRDRIIPQVSMLGASKGEREGP